jgi:hypothetical protein
MPRRDADAHGRGPTRGDSRGWTRSLAARSLASDDTAAAPLLRQLQVGA